jgi:hypothetical protein
MTTLNGSGQKTAVDLSLDRQLYSTRAFDAASGNLLNEQWYVPGASGTPLLQKKMTYDAAGNPLRLDEYDESGALVKTTDAASLTNAQNIGSWFDATQAGSPLGLVSSFPDGTIPDQAFTYDQAVAGMEMLKNGDVAGATQVFNYFNDHWTGDGYWTVYNTNTDGGQQVEQIKINGPNAWIGQFALQYEKQTGDSRALDLATDVGKWIQTLPENNGGIAMGNTDIWAGLYSVENNLSDYAFFKALSERAADAGDRASFGTTADGIQTWIRYAYDPTRGLFHRGGNTFNGGISWDTTYALDTNSWAIASLGVDGLKNLMGWDDAQMDAYVARIGSSFAVQAGGDFGGDLFTAKGFDFGDAANASAIGRQGVKWVEGTNQMIQVYQLMSTSYAASGDAQKAEYYASLARYFEMRNADNAVLQNGELGYLYADRAGVRVFNDIDTWSTNSGSSVAATAWTYFTSTGFNPFVV